MIKGIAAKWKQAIEYPLILHNINVNGLDEMIKETVAAVHNVELIPEA